ncbi:MAG: acyl-CoA dehydrogenase family protein [Kofleriaceae bacterium]
MIEFALTEEQTLVVEMAKNFATRELRPNIRIHEDHGVSSAVRTTAKSAGLAELWTESDTDLITRCVAAEELAFGDAGAALVLIGPALASAVVGRLGIDAKDVDALHVHEGAAPNAIAWLPIRGNGSETEPQAKILQLNRESQWRVVIVKAEPIQAIGLHAAGGAKCTVIDTVAAGEAGDRGPLAIAEARIAVASMLVGTARASLEYVSNYVQERTTFGKRLADHQGVAFIVADVAMATHAARMMVQRGAIALASGDPSGAAHAFVEAHAAALFAVERGVQMLGGHGYLKDHPVEKFMRDARALALYAGGRDIAAEDSEHNAWETRWV